MSWGSPVIRPVTPDDVTDARAAVKALRDKLGEAYTTEHAAVVARILAHRALHEAIERLDDLERQAKEKGTNGLR